MMNTYSSEQMPNDAPEAISYRDRWFYIKDTDTDLKQT
jgi:hypothetical protein